MTLLIGLVLIIVVIMLFALSSVGGGVQPPRTPPDQLNTSRWSERERAARASAERKQQHDEMMRALGHAPKLDTSLWSKRDREAYEKKHSK